MEQMRRAILKADARCFEDIGGDILLRTEHALVEETPVLIGETKMKYFDHCRQEAVPFLCLCGAMKGFFIASEIRFVYGEAVPEGKPHLRLIRGGKPRQAAVVPVEQFM